MPKYSMPVASLKAAINPLDGRTWNVAPIDAEEVLAAAQQGNVCDKSWQEMQKAQLPADFHRHFHVTRIAYLLSASSPAKEEHKMMLCVAKDRIWLNDGNHRVAAAIVRGDPTIELYIADSGELDLPAVFPGLCSLSED
ncbi:hypothetical protein G6M50_37025 [Agrobacterium rhizogenes]|nr:hypothetical protein [Rhizobium rhizogenes]NTJ83390.1 hypothetical protein [Rhizobium rhizogenes]